MMILWILGAIAALIAGYFIHREIKYGLPKLRREWDRVEYACHGMVRVMRHGKMGFVNQRHEIVVPPVLKGAGYFYEGYASVTLPDGRETYIDVRGRMLIPPMHLHSADWFDARSRIARIHVKSYRMPEIAVTTTTTDVNLLTRKGERLMLTEAVVTQHQLELREGTREYRDYWAIVQLDGTIIHMFNVDDMGYYDHGYFTVHVRGGGTGVIDPKGNVIVQPKWKKVLIMSGSEFQLEDFSGGRHTYDPHIGEMID